MRVFIGYGYNDRDKWIETYVFPLAEAFGCKVVHGKMAYGGALPPEVTDLIRGSDAMIGFTTRRDARCRTEPVHDPSLGYAGAGDSPLPGAPDPLCGSS
jgi:hypothetical protein